MDWEKLVTALGNTKGGRQPALKRDPKYIVHVAWTSRYCMKTLVNRWYRLRHNATSKRRRSRRSSASHRRLLTFYLILLAEETLEPPTHDCDAGETIDLYGFSGLSLHRCCNGAKEVRTSREAGQPE